ncbi:MAG: phage tail assembly chaperone [Hyphococcus sp.]
MGGGVAKWRAWFSLAVLRLGLSPAAFWALSVTEWRWLLAAWTGETGDVMDAAALHALLKTYPDKDQ